MLYFSSPGAYSSYTVGDFTMHVTPTFAPAQLLAAAALIHTYVCAKCDAKAYSFALLNSSTISSKGGDIVIAMTYDGLVCLGTEIVHRVRV